MLSMSLSNRPTHPPPPLRSFAPWPLTLDRRRADGVGLQVPLGGLRRARNCDRAGCDRVHNAFREIMSLKTALGVASWRSCDEACSIPGDQRRFRSVVPGPEARIKLRPRLFRAPHRCASCLKAAPGGASDSSTSPSHASSARTGRRQQDLCTVCCGRSSADRH
jgi:hypothetical protein